MATPVLQELLDYFERLSDPDKRQAAAEIMRRTVKLDLPSLTDEELALAAEDLFLELDQRESEDGHS